MLALRRAVVLAAVCGAVLAVSSCSPAASRPTPSPTTPVAMTDAEAFAAAEETYRAYVDALNNVDLADPATFEPVFALTTGELLESDRVGLTRYNAENLSVQGESAITSIEPRSRDTDQIQLDVCLDVSNVQLTNSRGDSLVAPDRAGTQRLVVVLEHADSDPTALRIAQVAGREDGPEC